MRLPCAAAAALSLGLLAACADDKKPDPKPAGDPAAKLAALKKKFDAEKGELVARIKKATTKAEADGIQAEFRELSLISAQSALEIAKADAKGEVGFDAAAFAIEKAGRFGGKELEGAAAVVAEHHLNNPKVKDLLPVIGQSGPAGEKFLQAAAEKATDKEVKGVALYLLGASAAAQLDDEEEPKKVDELIAKATGYFEKAAAEAPEAKVGGGNTVAKEVAEQLEGLKAIKNLAVGKPAPEVEGTALDGKKVKLSGYKGKVVLLDIWATWCGPCRAMIPHERKMVEANKGKPFVLLSVSCDNEQETLTKFLEKEEMPWDHWFDGPRGKVAKTFRVQAFPTLYLIDHAGVIRHKWVGNPGDEKLDKAVEELVKEAEKAKG